MKNIPVVEDNDDIIKLTDKNFDHQTKNKVVLVDFWADWCVPCRMMAPVLNDLAGDLKGNAYVGKVDVEQNRELAKKHNIRNIPTMVLFKNGKEVNRFVGVKTKDFLKSQIQKVA
ncbi:MAG: thioredoxin [Bacteroidales bacterium]|nr:thioredoxin [Bacteroidales bacterium]